MDDKFTIAEVAAELGETAVAVKGWINVGAIRAERIKGVPYISQYELARVVKLKAERGPAWANKKGPSLSGRFGTAQSPLTR